ncbi:PepSY domain-containing protein [uncultured Methanofollis sp.]|uniref:PepSY domain-containing protein n=1 Tax=uncultured Methanofollis sp. TaxID=262500 RepID=UPI00261A8578|nr:PepSY domain-containing protein [uncultured Methanofollis sp.]
MSKKIIGLALIGASGLSGSGNPVPPPTPPATDVPATPPANATGITGEDAKAIAIAAFPAIIGADTAEVRFIDQPQSRRSWQVDDFSADLGMPGARNAQVWVDADTGEIYQFTIHAGKQGRPADPAITIEEACAIAERYVGNRSAGEPLELLVKRYNDEESPLAGKVAGTYFIRYGRLIRGVPSATDGLIVEVDAVTGEIRQFSIDRKTDEADCRVATEPSVSSAQAEEVLKKYLRETYGDLPGLTIHETTLRWAIPWAYPDYANGVPLVWEISFDDDHYRSLTCPHYTHADIDAHTGDVLSCYYRPDAT